MAPALAPALIGQEAAACALLGLVLGSVRAVFPVRGRAAFLPDMALVGAVLLGLQSYAAALSAGGVLRWYMPGQRLSLRFWGRTASAACSAGTGTGAVLAGGGAAPAGPAGIAAAGSSPQKPGGAGQSAPCAKKKRKKTEKELAKHTAVVV